MENSKHNTSPKNDITNSEPASISFKQNLESRSNFDYFKPDQRMLKEQRENKTDLDEELEELL